MGIRIGQADTGLPGIGTGQMGIVVGQHDLGRAVVHPEGRAGGDMKSVCNWIRRQNETFI